MHWTRPARNLLAATGDSELETSSGAVAGRVGVCRSVSPWEAPGGGSVAGFWGNGRVGPVGIAPANSVPRSRILRTQKSVVSGRCWFEPPDPAPGPGIYPVEQPAR